MHCYNHHDREAVGTCKACHKGLCPDCANDLGHGLACKGKHESLVETYNMIIDRNAKVYGAAPKNMYLAPLFYLFMGLVFAWFGYTSKQGLSSLTFILGVGFVIFGVTVFIKNKQIFGGDNC